MAALVELLVTLATVLVEMTIHLLAGTFSATYFATRRRGLERICYALTAVLGVYLILGLMRGIIPVLATPILGAIYSLPSIIVAIIVFLFLLILPDAMRETSRRSNEATSDWKPVILSYVLAFVLVFGGLTIWTQTTRVPTMEERFCNALLARADDRILKTADKLNRWLADKRGKVIKSVSLCLRRVVEQDGE